jgi:hypothetical protein
MITLQNYKERIAVNQDELRTTVLELMAKENISLSRLSVEVGCSWATVKKFLSDMGLVSRETSDKLKEWVDSYPSE